MDTIRYLLGSVIKLAFGLFLLALVIWLVGLLYPQFTLSNLVSTNIFKRDWLPAPTNFAASFAPKNKNGTYGTVYQPNAPYVNQTQYVNQNGAPYKGQPGIEYVMYTESGTRIIKPDGSVVTETASGGVATNRLLYVRNLSLFDGGGITYAERFTGEARETMFKNGAFSILIVDTTTGKLIASIPALSTGTWAVPGWLRFQATIPVRLPANIACTMVFQSATQSLQVQLPVRCN